MVEGCSSWLLWQSLNIRPGEELDVRNAGSLQLRIASVKCGFCLEQSSPVWSQRNLFSCHHERLVSLFSLQHTLFSVMRGRDPSNNCCLHSVLQICSYSWHVLCIVSNSAVSTGEREVFTWGK